MLEHSRPWLVVVAFLAACVKVTPLDESRDDSHPEIDPKAEARTGEIAAPETARAERARAPRTMDVVKVEKIEAELKAAAQEPWPPPGLAVTHAGDEPREALKLAPAVGDRQEIIVSLDTKVGLRLGSQDVAPSPVPRVEVRLETQVHKVEDDAIHYTFVTKNVEQSGSEGVSARVAAAVNKATQSLRSAKGTFVIDRQGSVRSVDLGLAQTPDGHLQPTLEGFRQAFYQLVPPLPEQAVGVGATWRNVTDVDHNGLQMGQYGRYTLVAKEGELLKIDFEIEQRLRGDDTERAAVPGGTILVRGFSAAGKGQVSLDLSHVLPTEARSQTRSATDAIVAVGGKEDPVHMGVELEVSLRTPSGE